MQCDFHQRACFIISFPEVKIPELFNYDRFINQNVISIELNPSWYSDKFMDFWISCGPTRLDAGLEATLVCKCDPERNYSLEYSYILNILCLRIVSFVVPTYHLKHCGMILKIKKRRTQMIITCWRDLGKKYVGEFAWSMKRKQ